MSSAKNKKIAIVISTFSGLLEEEMSNYPDIFLTPLQLFVGDEQWYEGFYTNNEKYKIVDKFKNSNDFRTSLAPLSLIEEQMSKLSSLYDEVIYMPINSYLSSSHDNILNFSKQFKNVHVFNNKFVGRAYLYAAQEAKKRYEQENNSIDEIMQFLKWYDERTIGYIIPYEFKTFIKSGRLKGIKKAIMTSLNLSIIVEFDHVLTTPGVSRTKKIAASKIVQKIDDFIKKWNMSKDDFVYSNIYAFDSKIINILKDTLKENMNKNIDLSYEASLATMFHTGWGAGFLGINPKIEICPKFHKK